MGMWIIMDNSIKTSHWLFTDGLRAFINDVNEYYRISLN